MFQSESQLAPLLVPLEARLPVPSRLCNCDACIIFSIDWVAEGRKNGGGEINRGHEVLFDTSDNNCPLGG